MLAVSLLLCAMMALARADGDDAASGTSGDTAGITLFAATQCASDWTQQGGRCFQFVPTQKDWAAAQENCQLLGGTLASIHSLEEYQFIQTLTGPDHLQAWVGGYACQMAGHWFWTDSSATDYNVWCPGQPNNALDQCCLQINTGGGKCWDDQPCRQLNPSICVKPL